MDELTTLHKDNVMNFLGHLINRGEFINIMIYTPFKPAH